MRERKRQAAPVWTRESKDASAYRPREVRRRGEKRWCVTQIRSAAQQSTAFFRDPPVSCSFGAKSRQHCSVKPSLQMHIPKCTESCSRIEAAKSAVLYLNYSQSFCQCAQCFDSPNQRRASPE